MILLFVFAVLFLADVLVFSNDKEWMSGLFSVSLLVVGWFFWPPLQAFVVSHTVRELATYVAIYLGIGVGVSFTKWIFFNLRVASKLRSLKADFVNGPGKSFFKYVDDTIGTSSLMQKSRVSEKSTLTETFTPRAKNYVDRFTIWTLQWPVVTVDMIASEFLIKIGKHVASLTDALFSSIGKVLIGSVVKDLK